MSDKVEHPGWAIRFKDDDSEYNWLGIAHGICGVPADLTVLFKTEQEAKDFLKEEDQWYIDNCEVLEAWIPLVTKLRKEVQELKAVNRVSPQTMWSLRFDLDDIKSDLETVLSTVKKSLTPEK